MQVRFISNLRNILQQNEHYEGQVEFEESKMPVFEADNDDFTLTLYNLNYESSYATQTNENVTQGDTQDDTQEKILKMIEKNLRISTADMAKELGIGIATVKRKIKKMPNISYVGSGYSGHWEIKQVFENNESAYYCYKAIGFEDVPQDEIEEYNVMGEEWDCLELEIKL